TSTRAGTASTDTPVGVSDPVKTDTPTVSTGTLPAGGTTVSSATNLPTRPPSDTPTPTPSATTTLTPTRLPTATPVQSSSPTTLDLPPLPAITPRPSLPAGRPSDFARPATETLEGEIRQNTILERGRGPYTVNGAVVVKQDVTLFIEPGTVLKFSDDAHLVVYGTLRAQGMPDSPIVFTSIRDDSVGGDTNQDGQSSAPVPGDWTYIGFFVSSNDAGSIIEHAVIRYAGEHRGDRHGAIHLEAASPVLRSNTISDSYWYAISADPNSFPFVQNNTLERNQGNGIAIRGGNLTVSGAWANTDIAYAVVGVVNVRESTTLLIYPGITAKFGDDVFIDVFGALKAQGAPGQEIVLTSLKDDSVGGDTNGDGESSAPGAGDWTMIRFQPTSNDANSLIAHCRIRYAGDHRGDRYGAVHISESSPRLISNSFTDNRWFAISADVNSFPTLSGNSLERNGGNGLEMRAGEERISGAWANTDTVYAITGAFRVNEGATLSIRPGVTAKFADDAYVDVFGALRVLGTADQKVILTSLKDDTAGGDTNGDGGSSAPAAGDWTMIRFRDSSSDASSVVEHARVRYAGGFRGDRFGALHMESASPRIANSELTDSLWFALSADTASFPIVSNVETRGNSGNGLEMRGGDMSNSGTWSNTGIVYVLTGSVIVLNTATLNVQPGVIVKFADSTFIGVHGTLRALGTADDPIVLTSLRDDSQGGDTNGDDRSSSPAAGDWGMLHFYDESNDANCLVENTIIRYGGKYRGDRYGAIHLISASPTIAGCTIQDSLAWGLWYDTGSTPRLRNNTFARNPEGDTYQKQ
ncbi:MAG: right-handed parallel beta-helix repeat-containing protein, partial [Anaerolineae bacterium]